MLLTSPGDKMIMSFGFALDGVAIIIAIILVASKSRIDNAHGWAKIALEIVVFLFVANT
jgi:hypothetical protein